MSSDEEIIEDRQDRIRRYRVTRKCWLSSELAALHAVVDARSLRNSRETFTRGSIPHHRVRDAVPPLSQNRAVVVGLPGNVYNQEYLARLDGFDRQLLREREPHPF